MVLQAIVHVLNDNGSGRTTAVPLSADTTGQDLLDCVRDPGYRMVHLVARWQEKGAYKLTNTPAHAHRQTHMHLHRNSHTHATHSYRQTHAHHTHTHAYTIPERKRRKTKGPAIHSKADVKNTGPS